MRQRYREILANAEQAVDYVSDFVAELAETSETRVLWRAWSGILDHYVKAVSALRRATDQGESKAWSDGLIHQQRNDSILQYAYQSRDHTTHVFEGKREASPRSLNVGSFISLSGNSSVTLSNNTIIDAGGRASKLPDGLLNIKDGRYAGGTISRDAVQEREHFIKLKDVKTRSGVWPIPNQHTHPEKQAIEIALHIDNWLKTKLAEAKKWQKKIGSS